MEEREEVLDPIPCFLRACEIERGDQKTVHKEARVRNGRLEKAEGRRFVYAFLFDGQKAPCKPGSTTRITVYGSHYSAVCISVDGNTIKFSVSTTLGSEIPSARVQQDGPDILQCVIEILRDVQQGVELSDWNKQLADRLLSLKSTELVSPGDTAQAHAREGLTEDQSEAIRVALTRDITFLWGPPGTGKTKTLGSLVGHMYRQNKRVLLISHTNDAVDALLYSALKEVSHTRSGNVAEASVLRLGASVLSELKLEYGDRIDIDEVVRLGQEKVLARLEQMKIELRGLRASCFTVSKGLSLWRSFSDLTRELQHLRNQQRPSRPGNISQAIRGVFSSRPQQSADGEAGEHEVLQEAIELLEKQLGELEEKLPAESYEELLKQSSEESTRQVELTEAINVLETFLRDLRKEMIARARVVACTATQAILAMKTLKDFDMVVVDEASMLPLPYVYLVAGMAKDQVVVAGDFRQLPAIVHSRNSTVLQWYGRDIFEYAGIVDLVDQGGEHPSLVMLSSQFRSHRDVCALINKRFYAGRLRSIREEDDYDDLVDGAQLEGRITVVDTSSLNAWVGLEDGSKYNLQNALVVRKLALLLRAKGEVSEEKTLGIISPYRQQAQLVSTLLEEYGASDHITAGTAHAFQGAEATSVILDLTEGPPQRVGRFSRGVSLRDVGARLLNVALSRAKDRIFIVGNIGYLQSQLPTRAVLGAVLQDAIRYGRTLPIEALITQPLFVNPALEYAQTSGVLAFQIFDQNLLSPALLTDLLDAEREVTIAGSTLCFRTASVLSVLLEERIKKGLRVTLRVPVSKSKRPDSQGVLDKYREAGVAVTYCDHPVYPMVVLDSEVVWLGSLSPLDTISGQQGRMIRCVSVVAAQRALSYIEGARDGEISNVNKRPLALVG
jgi:hypothetical protein